MEPYVRWGPDRTNLFAVARGDKKATRSFAKLRWTFVIILLSLVVLVVFVSDETTVQYARIF